MKDYYEILGVSIDATNEQIKRQYHLLLHAWHPDKFPTSEFKSEAEEKIKDLNEAYSVLSNPSKRTEYDRQRDSNNKVSASHVSENADIRNEQTNQKGANSTNDVTRQAFDKEKFIKPKAPKSIRPVLGIFLFITISIFTVFIFIPSIQPSPAPTAFIPVIQPSTPKPTKKAFATSIVITPTPPFSDFVDEFGVPMNLIPEGEFIMGTDNSNENEKPAHKVYVDSYYIDLYEVTNYLYRNCVIAGACHRPSKLAGLDNPKFNNYLLTAT